MRGRNYLEKHTHGTLNNASSHFNVFHNVYWVCYSPICLCFPLLNLLLYDDILYIHIFIVCLLH